MSLWSSLNRNVFKRTSTFAIAVAGGTFFFERSFELISVSIFESINKGIKILSITDNCAKRLMKYYIMEDKVTSEKLNILEVRKRCNDGNDNGSVISKNKVTGGENNNMPRGADLHTKTKKRLRNPAAWKKNIRSHLKNSGQEYISQRGKLVAAKEMKPPCTSKCKHKCSENFSEEERYDIFKMYWDLSCLQRQRDFLISTITVLELAQRRLKTDVEKNRKPNTYYSLMSNGNNYRVCKLFLLNTLGISDRTLRTMIEAKTCNDSKGTAPSDKRGCHGNHKETNLEIQESVWTHINSINRISNHHLRIDNGKEYIDGALTIAELHRDYKKIRESEGKEAASYDLYFKMFNTEFKHLSFFVPRQDQCEVCGEYENADEDDKKILKTEYIQHCQQSVLSRIEKTNDIELCKNTDSNEIVAIYDLQSVMPVPVGESSPFYYKSKLNCFNFTVSDVKDKQTYCYFWHEAMGGRGPVEIGSCVFKYLQRVADKHPGCNITFYSYNCGGQQRERLIFSIYLYAVKILQIHKITHKFLIRGHNQSERDTAYSIIEKTIKKAKKSGSIYVPDQYVQIIRAAKKKGSPFIVEELNFDDFIDLKKLSDEIELNMVKDVDGNTIKTTDVKVIEFQKDNDAIYKYKFKFDDSWNEAEIRKRKPKSTNLRTAIKDINLVPAYTSKRVLSTNKRNDLRELLQKNIIPRYYSTFYESIL